MRWLTWCGDIGRPKVRSQKGGDAAVAQGRRRLRRAKGKTGRLSYREISARLKDAGYCNERGQPFNPQSVRAMIEGPQPWQRRAERHRLINSEQD